MVDDSPEIRRLVGRALAQDGFEVEQAGDGEAAVQAARARPPDVVVLDLGLPRMDGIEVCRRLREFSDAYVIMLTGRASEIDSLIGLAVGADDYVVKPASPRVIVARARAMLRRPRGDPAPEGVRRIGSLEVDVAAREVRVDGEPVGLTRMEFDILEMLSASPHAVIARAALLDRVWGGEFEGDDHRIDVHVSNLRRKIGSGYVRTVRGVGYRLVEE